jgi:prepilin-type N-terminal cleavage/methylation domain-containing protein
MNRLKMKKAGFTLMEMLVVIGIIATLMGVAVAGFGGMTKRAQRTKTQELVSNAATALTMIFQEKKSWPKPIVEGMSQKRLTRDVCAAFVRHGKGLLGISYKNETGEDGVTRRVVDSQSVDRFGLIDPYAAAVVRRDANASLSTRVSSGGTINDHILHYSVDLDGDGITEVVSGGRSMKVRATACVWSFGADGAESPSRSRGDDVYSWRPDQEVH